MPRGDSAQTVKATLGLRQMLFDGRLRPGERLVEVALVKELGVSRTPLRLAFGTLEHEGLLEAIPGGGFAARELTRRDVNDAIELRGALEGVAARLAVERLEGPDELGPLTVALEQLDRVVRDDSADAILLYVSLNEEFHAQLVLLARSDVLSRQVDRLNALPFAAPGASLLASHMELQEWRETRIVAQHQHRAIVDAIEARDGGRAEEVAREHARLSRRNLDLLIEHGAGLRQVVGVTLADVGDEASGARAELRAIPGRI